MLFPQFIIVVTELLEFSKLAGQERALNVVDEIDSLCNAVFFLQYGVDLADCRYRIEAINFPNVFAVE